MVLYSYPNENVVLQNCLNREYDSLQIFVSFYVLIEVFEIDDHSLSEKFYYVDLEDDEDFAQRFQVVCQKYLVCVYD